MKLSVVISELLALPQDLEVEVHGLIPGVAIKVQGVDVSGLLRLASTEEQILALRRWPAP